MKLSTNHLRVRAGIDSETIKRIITLEDDLNEGRLTKDSVFEITDIYSRFTEYLEYIRDPLKLYFQLRIESLFKKKTVAKMLIEDSNKNVTGKKKNLEILSDDFLNFSEISDLRLSTSGKINFRSIDSRMSQVISNPPSSKFKSNKDTLMMFKVNDEILKINEQETKISTHQERFLQNDTLVKESLENQEIELSKKLRQRRNKNISKENMSFSRSIAGSVKSFSQNTSLMEAMKSNKNQALKAHDDNDEYESSKQNFQSQKQSYETEKYLEEGL